MSLGFQKMFPGQDFEIEGASVPSGVGNQPRSNQETLQGALNRVENIANLVPADFWVGIEHGVEGNDLEMETSAWIIIKSKDGKIGKAKSGTYFMPKEVRILINQGKEIGEADDIFFGKTNSKQENGAVGILTDNVVDRTKLYTEAVILALIPLKNINLY